MRTSRRIRRLPLAVAFVLAAGCAGEAPAPESGPAVAGLVERWDPRLDGVIAPDATVDTLATGFDWSEGPVWVPDLDALLFSDVPQNRIHAWSPATGIRVWLEPAGYTSAAPGSGNGGPNGLLLDAEGRLVICQHGDRRVARLDAPLEAPAPAFETVVATWEGARFNSPNDAAYRSDGSLWFTDPPYGLPDEGATDDREIPFNGVYVLRPDGRLEVVTDTLTRPNGIAFSPDERTLYVANSDAGRAWWVAIDLGEDGSVGEGRILLDVTAQAREASGLPDGLKVDRDGNLVASGPGGVWIVAPDGTALGRIRTGTTANVAFGEDGRSLFITAWSRLLRTRVLTGA